MSTTETTKKPIMSGFKTKGLLEPVRVALEVAGVEYEQKAYDYGSNEFLELKPKLPFSQLPLYVDHQVSLVQTMAILRYIGRQYHMYGNNDQEAAYIDEAIEAFLDLKTVLLRAVFDPEIREKLDVYGASILPWLTDLENYLKRNKGGDGYFVGERFSIADACMYSVFDNYIKKLWPVYLDFHPLLSAYTSRIAELPAIQNYISSGRRPLLTLPPYAKVLSTPEDCQ